MIDIIIPVYNSQKTIAKTLASIVIQKIRNNTKVYIVDDCSTGNYDKELAPFKDILDITYIRLDKNMGPGYARQVGIDNSSSDYIVFIDSVDQFYNYYSLYMLYSYITLNNADIVMGYYYVEENNKKFLSDDSYIYSTLHGKIYRRKHLEDHNIRFNNSRYSEDNSFNTLAIYTSNNVLLIDNIISVYTSNESSLTNTRKNLIKMHSSYLHNALWVINKFEKLNIDQNVILSILLNSYVYIFKITRQNPDVNFGKLFLCCYKYEEKYKKYENLIPDDIIFDCICHQFYCDISTREHILKEFAKFRNNFVKKVSL